MYILSTTVFSVPGNVDFYISGMTSHKLCNCVATFYWMSFAEHKFERHSSVS